MLRTLVLFSVVCLLTPAAHGGNPFVIEVVDAETGRGVPLVQLRTTSSTTYYTDSNGLVAFDEPEWMDRRVFFFVESPGYEMPPNGFGMRGQQFQTIPGGTGRIKLPRTAIAERLYRMTGAGIYRDTVASGREAPIRNPLLNGGVIGSDSVVNAIYRDRIYWFWGDTSRQSSPLGNFHVPGATSLLPSNGGLDPAVGVDLKYFMNERDLDRPFAKETARMAGDGPTWIGGLIALPDKNGREWLFASYLKIKPPTEIYRRGLCRWNDEKEIFEHVVEFPLGKAIYPFGHPFIVREDDTDYVYFPEPMPLVRVRARAENLMNLDAYEAFTCLPQGTIGEVKNAPEKLPERNQAGQLSYAWKRGTSALTQRHQRQLVHAREIEKHEGLIQLRDRDTGESVLAHGGSVYWNEYRQRWISIFVQLEGKSMLGEMWYSEAEHPLGPWVYAIRIATHGNYSFYNPKQHPMFDADGGRVVYFEGTYTNSFSGNPHQTPWYDYNQLMYRLDLNDHRLVVPRPVYRSSTDEISFKPQDVEDDDLPQWWTSAPWFAADQPVRDGVAVNVDPEGLWHASSALENKEPPNTMFYALPADIDEPPSTTVALFEYSGLNGERHYDLENATVPTGFQRAEKPLCRVWRSPWITNPR